MRSRGFMLPNAIVEARIKTDTLGASTFSHLLRANLILSVYVPLGHTRKKREMLRRRISLLRMGTRVRSRLHALIGWLLRTCHV